MKTSSSATLLWATAVPAIIIIGQLLRRLRQPKRLSRVLPSSERVLVLGGGTGVGKEIARQYYSRGAKVIIVGRRPDKLAEVVAECKNQVKRDEDLLYFPGDISSVDDMISLRDLLVEEWGGCDTIILSAGVSALKPILGIAGADPEHSRELQDIDKDGIQRTLDATEAATRANYYGPLVVVTTLLPLLTRTSKSPSILLVSSLGALIPCPTRALYGSTKAASLVMYQAMSVEHPGVAFSYVLPTTIEGSFRASAVDQGPVRESDPNKSGLKVGAVAARCIQAVDNGERTVFMPGAMAILPTLYTFLPALVDKFTRKKYKYHPVA